MKYFSLFLLLNMSFFLSGCNPFANYSYKPLTVEETQDLNYFLNQNYPVGSDEKKLISDYTARGYKYIIELSMDHSKALSKNLDSDKNRHTVLYKRLSSNDNCSWLQGAEGNIDINWSSDSQGKIKNISAFKGFCLLTP